MPAVVDDRRAEADAAPAQVAERGDRLWVGPLKVVEEEHERGMLGDERDEGLEHLDLVELPASARRA